MLKCLVAFANAQMLEQAFGVEAGTILHVVPEDDAVRYDLIG